VDVLRLLRPLPCTLPLERCEERVPPHLREHCPQAHPGRAHRSSETPFKCFSGPATRQPGQKSALWCHFKFYKSALPSKNWVISLLIFFSKTLWLIHREACLELSNVIFFSFILPHHTTTDIYLFIPHLGYLDRSLKFIWAPCAQLYSLADWDPATSPPRIWAHIRGPYWSDNIDDISLWPLIPPLTIYKVPKMKIRHAFRGIFSFVPTRRYFCAVFCRKNVLFQDLAMFIFPGWGQVPVW
jgi:hypothetical protein